MQRIEGKLHIALRGGQRFDVARIAGGDKSADTVLRINGAGHDTIETCDVGVRGRNGSLTADHLRDTCV